MPAVVVCARWNFVPPLSSSVPNAILQPVYPKYMKGCSLNGELEENKS